jgi:hypothetical protein
MFQRNSASSLQSDCVHTTITEDWHEGTVICVQCGLVLDETLFMSDWDWKSKSASSEDKEDKAAQFTSEKREELKKLYEIADLWHVSSASIDTIKFNHRKWVNKLNDTRIKSKEILAYAVYSYLLRNGYNFGPNDICSQFELKNWHILFEIAHLVDDKSMASSSNFIQYNSELLELPYKAKWFLLQLMEKETFIDLSHHLHPRSLSIIVLVWFCSIHYPNYTCIDICKKCCGSYQIIRKLVRTELTLKNYVLNEIKEKYII